MVFQFICAPNQRILWVHFFALIIKLMLMQSKKNQFSPAGIFDRFSNSSNHFSCRLSRGIFFTRHANCDKHMPNGVGDIRRHAFWLRVQKWLAQDLWALAIKIRPLNKAFFGRFSGIICLTLPDNVKYCFVTETWNHWFKCQNRLIPCKGRHSTSFFFFLCFEKEVRESV